MNIDSILYKIKLFDDLIVGSGFKRDLDSYVQALSQGQNRNLVFMRKLSEDLEDHFQIFLDNNLDSELNYVLKDTTSFMNLEVLENIEDLIEDNEITADLYFNQLNQIIHRLANSLKENIEEIENIRSVFSKYVDEEKVADNGRALMSLVFKDLESTKTLKEFGKILHRWESTILIYHRLLKSDSPEEIGLVNIQNGSIDVVFNLDFEIALDLTELIKEGVMAFSAYLLYKSGLGKNYYETIRLNKELKELEVEKERLMLENIKKSVELKIIEQHKEKLKTDKKIDKKLLDQGSKTVSRVITDHIVRGNEVKLLNAPIKEEDDEKDHAEELRKETARTKQALKQISDEEKQKLLILYKIPGLDEENTDLNN